MGGVAEPSAHSMSLIDCRCMGRAVSFRANSVRLKAEMHSRSTHETLVSDGPGLARLRHRDSRDSVAPVADHPLHVAGGGPVCPLVPRFHRWLLAHPWFGPPIHDWQLYRGIRRHARRRAIVFILLSFSVSLMVVPLPWVRLLLVVIMVILLTWLMRLPVLEPVAMEK